MAKIDRDVRDLEQEKFTYDADGEVAVRTVIEANIEIGPTIDINIIGSDIDVPVIGTVSVDNLPAITITEEITSDGGTNVRSSVTTSGLIIGGSNPDQVALEAIPESGTWYWSYNTAAIPTLANGGTLFKKFNPMKLDNYSGPVIIAPTGATTNCNVITRTRS